MPRAAPIATLAMLTCIVHAGPLNPPAGPPTSTDTALRQTDPRIPLGPTTTPGDANSVLRITAPGSYYLSADLVGPAGQSGIEIATSNVTIDLNGYTLRGTPGSLSGIAVDPAGAKNITITNGRATGWAGVAGVNLSLAFGNVVIDRVISSDNAGAGIITSGNAVVTSCVAQANAADGFVAGFDCKLNACIAIDNQAAGFRLAAGFSNATNCVANFNGGEGFIAADTCIIHACLAYSNALDGFNVGAGSHISGSVARNNTNNGFFLFSGSQIVDSTAYDNGADNIHARFGCSIINCTARIAGANGIRALGACLIENSLSQFATAAAISVGQASVVRNCVAINAADGIVTTGDACVITNNHSALHASAAYVITDRDTVSGCHAANSPVGFLATGTDSSLIANTSTGNNLGYSTTTGPGGNLLIRNVSGGDVASYGVTLADCITAIVGASNIATNTRPDVNYEF